MNCQAYTDIIKYMEEQQEKTYIEVYVIMPFSKTVGDRTEDYWTEHYEHFIKSQLEEIVNVEINLKQFNWGVYRSSVERGGPLNYEITWDLLNAPIVIADITDLNSNVLYELGIRHALTASIGSRRTIMIQDSSAFKLPFDFANYSVVKYDKTRLDTWKKTLSKRLIECITNFSYKDNPVSMAFAQHSFSFTSENQQVEGMKQLQLALDLIQQMVDIGFSVDWVQSLITSQTQVQPQSASTLNKKVDDEL
jgi:hypothetical protein